MSESLNPYAAPLASIEHIEANTDAEDIRKTHLKTEASVKAVGTLYVLGGFLLVCGSIISFVSTIAKNSAVSSEVLFPLVGMVLLTTVFGILQIAGGIGLRRLKPWARIAGTIVSVIGLLGFPIGTIISGYILYLLWGKKSRTLFTPEYQDVIAATPHIKYKTSIIVWILLGLIVLLIALAIIIPFTR